MTVLVNGRDEPHVVFDVGPLFDSLPPSSSKPVLPSALALTDPTPFTLSLPNTGDVPCELVLFLRSSFYCAIHVDWAAGVRVLSGPSLLLFPLEPHRSIRFSLFQRTFRVDFPVSAFHVLQTRWHFLPFHSPLLSSIIALTGN
jgi:hypothetical protein